MTVGMRRGKRRWWPLGVRARLVFSFTLGAVLITALLAMVTWKLATGYMIHQRQAGAVGQARANARLVQDGLRRGGASLSNLLTGLARGPGSAVFVLRATGPITSQNSIEPHRLPARLLSLVRAGTAARQRLVFDGTPVLAVGLPMPQVPASYIELFPLREIDQTFRFLSTTLLTATLVSSIFGGALGAWASRRALRPLVQLTAAAGAVAHGDLRVRLHGTRDTDLAPLAAAFNATVDRLQRRVEQDGRFASDVSHELRSPLTTMVNAVAVLHNRRSQMSAGAQQAVDLLAEEVTRFRCLVEDLLEISRADQGDSHLVLEQVDLVELVRQALASTASTVAPLIEAAPGELWVRGDRRRLVRVVGNLIENAERYGGVTRLAICRSDRCVRIEVDDAGPGVPAADRERIFERFAKTASGTPSTGGGTGLGLALVAQHVRLHQGRVWVQDRPGGGARFVVELPEVPT